MKKYSDSVALIDPWANKNQPDKSKESSVWTFISDGKIEFRDLNTIRYCKKDDLKFFENKVNTDFKRLKLWVFLAIHDYEEFETVMKFLI
jgi:hypothetical protein